ncbi:MAG: cation efflux family protein [bacterium]|nr:MAG: cation efflux family protein [bacterium]
MIHNHQHNVYDDHTHGVVDPSLFTAQRGIWAIKLSFLGLLATALFQSVIVLFSGSVALLADTIHNLGDAATTIPLWVAFRLARWKPTKRFTYGYGRVEDLAGVAIVFIILLSAVIAGYESIHRLSNPWTVEYLWAVIVASVIGFLGNEAVAVFRIKVGKEIGSAALVADGYHARIDGLTSLAVLFGAGGVWLGYPLADPIVGLIITAAILRILWESGKAVFTRLLDGVDPEVIEEIKHAVNNTPGVEDVTQTRVRWLGHQLHAEVNIAVTPELSVERGHEIAVEVEHQLLHSLRYLSNVTIHVDPANASGEEHHHSNEHECDDLPHNFHK